MSHHHDDFEVEPIPGLPEELPDGEVILWQGAPNWRVVAKRTFHLPLLGVYFLVLLLIKASFELLSGGGVLAAIQGATGLAFLSLVAAGLFALYAKLIAGSTVYTITNRRLVMRFGVALPMTFNLPFAQVQSASVKSYPGGFGDIPITLDESQKISYIVMWPNVRPWHLKRPEPMLRCVPNAMQVAEILADAASGVALAETSPTAKTQAEREPVGQDQVPMGEMA